MTEYYSSQTPRKVFGKTISAQVMDRGIDPQKTPRLEGDGMEYVEKEMSASRVYRKPAKCREPTLDMSIVSILPEIRQSMQDEQLIKIVTLENDVKKMKDERAVLESKLQEQIKVNKEVKRLLVASVGADLYQQMEDVTRDKIRLAEDLDNTIQTLTEERETNQQLGIQCDVWRSKFLGSRVQVDELVSCKYRSSMAYEESKMAIDKLLTEREEMRSHMMEANKKLQYLSDALQRSHTLSHEEVQPSTNVMTLSLVNHQLSATISQHLLGDMNSGNKKKTVSATSASNLNFVEWTPAEMLAKDILLNKKLDRTCTDSIDDTTSNSDNTSPSNTPKPYKINRFHPLTKYENLTVNCCRDCTGEIRVV
ncbi:golgin-45-like [Glandiceps talaboti]